MEPTGGCSYLVPYDEKLVFVVASPTLGLFIFSAVNKGRLVLRLTLLY